MGDEWLSVLSPCYLFIFILLGQKVTGDECFSFYCCPLNKRRRRDRLQTGVSTPRIGLQNNNKPRMGDRIYNVFNISMLRSLSPPRGFLCRCNITGGLHPRLWSLVPSGL